MLEPFPIIEVPPDASQHIEDLGTKEKFWFRHQDLGHCLFKKARPNTGEDWAEKIAAELCELLGLPHAYHELATLNGDNGTISPSFLCKNGSLITGNEILARRLPSYPQDLRDHSQHTIDNVLNAIGGSEVNLPIGWKPPEGISNAVDTFVGYLLLDAWIGNTDRHHENWAFISVEDKIYLAPTYDHGSCLGRNEPDSKRKERLITKDVGFSVHAYVEKCSSNLYARVRDKKTLKNFDVFYQVRQRYPDAARVWLDNLAKVSSNDTLELFERIPSHRISKTATEFAQKILELNQNRLLKLRDTLL
ncbi:HipA-like protein [Cylindrospermum stagnale PCC 7417]|uniref:HipA-like protein n=1 Tax=Cylindrospermum stagnale PCC 7417 TaxID=56107 RepID=K9WWL2_9NOST|nr:HipA-like protein [Cylindrospermum stagnale]AFZ23917.1 HipA-like protein [Cylindrospermum stagnale PCC 7417]